MKEYRVYYKDKTNTTWDEWYEPAGTTQEEAEEVKNRIENMKNVYDVVIRTVDCD